MEQINIMEHQGLIHMVINGLNWSYENTSLTRDDLVQECNIGLMEAVKGYDPAKGVFSSYAVHWIKQAAYRAYQNTGSMIRKPSHIHQQYSDYKKACLRFESVHQRKPTNEEIASRLNTTVEAIEDLQQAFSSTVSTDTPIKDDDKMTLGDVLEDEAAPYDELLYRIDIIALRHDLEAYMRHLLNDTDIKIIKYRYGWDDQEPLTIQAISDLLNLDTSTINNKLKASHRRLYQRYGPTITRNYPDLIHHHIATAPINELALLHNMVRSYSIFSLRPGSRIHIDDQCYRCIGSNKFYVIYSDGQNLGYVDMKKIQELIPLKDGSFRIEIKPPEDELPSRF